MRLASSRLVAVPIVALTFAVTACGANTVTVQEVPGAPVELSVPGTAEAFAPAATATPTATPTETPDASTSEATPTPDAATDDGGGAAETTPQDTTEGGAEAPAAGDDSATTDQPPPAGSDAQQFEDFCAENPGAC